MMKSEFYDRTGYFPTDDEYDMIELAYYISDKNKDDFCKEWIMENATGIWEKKIPILQAVGRAMSANRYTERKMREEIKELKETVEMQHQKIEKLENEWIQFAE